MADWIITMPKRQFPTWESYLKELFRAETGEVLNYRIPYKADVQHGDRVFVVWDGCIRGWMRALGVAQWPHGFTCSTTGKQWPPGVYVQRTGAFHTIDGRPMRGFRGIRKYTKECQSDGSL